MNEMMSMCCGKDGKPELEKMKSFMHDRGKASFSEDEMQRMKQFCQQDNKADPKEMKQFMENCGCCVQ